MFSGAMAGRRRAVPRLVVEEGGDAPRSKGKNFMKEEEEEQLVHSVLQITFDPITGNAQRGNTFWKRIFVDYDEHHPQGFRGSRSLESK
jgi:hypothetical protein